jgi:hypothetical protein
MEALQKNLAILVEFKSQKERVALDNTLDAFIQLGANALPLELLQSVYNRSHVPALILISQSSMPQPQADGFMRKLLHEASVNQTGGALGTEWFTGADFLFSHHAPGFIAAVLQDLKITGYVTVCDPGGECKPSPRGTGYASSIPAGGMDASFPPWPKYGLVKEALPDDTVFIQGPTPLMTMSYRRHVDKAPGFSPSVFLDSSPLLPTNVERMSYVAAFAPQVRVPSMEDGEMSFVWRNNPSAYDSAVAIFRQGLVDHYSSMIHQLRDAGLLSDDEAIALEIPNINIQVENKRN